MPAHASVFLAIPQAQLVLAKSDGNIQARPVLSGGWQAACRLNNKNKTILNACKPQNTREAVPTILTELKPRLES
jgi:hypothetical protein